MNPNNRRKPTIMEIKRFILIINTTKRVKVHPWMADPPADWHPLFGYNGYMISYAKETPEAELKIIRDSNDHRVNPKTMNDLNGYNELGLRRCSYGLKGSQWHWSIEMFHWELYMEPVFTLP